MAALERRIPSLRPSEICSFHHEIAMRHKALLRVMPLAVAILSRRSFAFRLYAATLDGRSVQDLSKEYGMAVHRIQEELDATRLALGHQLKLEINPNSTAFRA